MLSALGIPLADGWFPSTSCAEHAGLLYAATVFAILVGAILYSLMTRYLYQWDNWVFSKSGPTYDPDNSFPFKKDTKTKSLIKVTLASVMGAAFIIAMAAPLSSTTVSIFATPRSIVETGCEFLTSYQFEIDRRMVAVAYRYKKDADGRHTADWIDFSDGTGRSIRVQLQGTPYLENLTAIAPDAVRQYRDQVWADSREVVGQSGS